MSITMLHKCDKAVKCIRSKTVLLWFKGALVNLTIGLNNTWRVALVK